MQITKTYHLTISQQEMNFLLDVFDHLDLKPEHVQIHAHMHNKMVSANQGEDV